MQIKWPYLLVWSFIIRIEGHRITESSESAEQNLPEDRNTTTLYPITTTTEPTKTDGNNDKNKVRSEATVWKLETAFAESKLPENVKDNGTESKELKELEGDRAANCSKEFKPSPQLGTFYDGSSETFPTRASFSSSSGPFVPIRKPATGFFG